MVIINHLEPILWSFSHSHSHSHSLSSTSPILPSFSFHCSVYPLFPAPLYSLASPTSLLLSLFSFLHLSPPLLSSSSLSPSPSPSLPLPSRATMEASLPMARLVQERHTQLKEERKPCVGSSRECQRRSSSVSTLQHTMHLHLSTARGQSSDCPIHLQWNLSIEDTLNRGHLSNEDTVCSANHIDLSTNLPLN